MIAHGAPSSSITDKWTYDAFLSFHGVDTRLGFISHLHHSLHQSGIHAFIDDDFIRTGENITPALFRAIQESRIAIIVFSENYADSTFCLQELEKILECFKEETRLIYPVFYYVDPSELRRPRESYAKALAQQEERFKHNRQIVDGWRKALSRAADFKGCHLKLRIANEQECTTRITNEVAAWINKEPLFVTNYPVGLVSRVNDVISYLNLGSIEEIKMIGIWGVGGIGKSTIARAVYNSIADNFEGLCFLSDVKGSKEPNGLTHLQKKLLSKLVMEEGVKLSDYHEGIPIIKHRLSQMKVLLILDDVDKSDQLKALAGRCDWFGSGSRIIITTRNKQLLVSHGIECIYDVKGLDDEESLKLLSWLAFKKENVDSNYMELCNRAIHLSCGFPLVLEVIGSNLRRKGVDIWRSALDLFKSESQRIVLDTLKLSYDTLEEVEKQVFLDLACLFNGEKLADVNHILLCVRVINPHYAIEVLVDKSLIKIERGRVIMHDLIEDFGKEIVRRESNEPGERSRLWFYEDILHVLQQDTGTNKVEAMILDLPESIEVQWGGKEFMKMKNLKMLVIRKACFSECPKYMPNGLRWLEWKGYPVQFLQHMCPTELVYLDLSYSYCELLHPFDKKFLYLSHMNLRKCKFLQQIPDLSGASNLTELQLDGCTNLVEIHDSVGCLNELKVLSAMRCKKLKIFPSYLRLRSLERLNLFGCSSLQRFPEILVLMEKLQALDLDKTGITELPSSMCNLVGLESLNLEECPNLKQLPASIFTLPNLWKLTANSSEGMSHFNMCEGGDEARLDCLAMSLKLEQLYFSNCNLSDDSLAFCLSHFRNMMHLDLSFNDFTVLPVCIKDYHNLKLLRLDNCNQLQHIEGMPPNLEIFSAICCTSLTDISKSEVLNQAFNFQPGKRNFIFPGKEFPERLHNYSRGSFLSFWVRDKSPTIFLWILIKDDLDYVCNCKFSVHVNETKLDISSKWLLQSTIKTDHIYICDLLSIVHDAELPLRDKWNQVKVSIEGKTQEIKSKKEIYFGVHVYNRQSNLEKIQFMDPRFQEIQEEFMNLDSNSTKSAKTIENCEHCQDQPQDRGEIEDNMQQVLDLVKYAKSPEIKSSQEGDSMNKLQPDWDVFGILKVGGYKGTTYSTCSSGGRSYNNLIELCLTKCNNCWKIPTLGQLPALRSLTIETLQNVVSIGSEFFKAPDSASFILPFPSLETLHLEDLISWKKWHSTGMEAFPKLHTLRFLNCPKLVGDLPHQLVSLECLEINGCPLLASSIPECPKIQELHIIGSQKVMLQGKELPPSVRLLAISDARMLEPVSGNFHIKDLFVQGCSDVAPLGVIHMPPLAERLRITNCENLMFVLISKAPLLVHLRRISIRNCKFLTSLFDDMERFLPNLKVLSIAGCPEMEPFSAGCLPSSLQQLEIRNCDKLLSCRTELHHLPSSTLLIMWTESETTLHCCELLHLTSLQQLEILNSFNLEKIEGENQMSVLISKAPSLVHLQRIIIRNCKFLTSLFDDMERLLPNLKEISIEGCPEMEPFSAGYLPSSLKRLEIRNCDKLLSCRTEWNHLPSITWLIISTNSRTLYCYGLQHLTSLQQLQILNSPNLEKIEGGIMPPSLECLEILGPCCRLSERCRKKDKEIWPKISHVPSVSLQCRDAEHGQDISIVISNRRSKGVFGLAGKVEHIWKSSLKSRLLKLKYNYSHMFTSD